MGGTCQSSRFGKPIVVTVPPSWGVAAVASPVGWDESPAAAGKDAPDYDLCQVTVADTNMFCLESLQTKEYPEGIPRVEMPQLSGTPVPGSQADALDRADSSVQRVLTRGQVGEPSEPCEPSFHKLLPICAWEKFPKSPSLHSLHSPRLSNLNRKSHTARRWESAGPPSNGTGRENHNHRSHPRCPHPGGIVRAGWPESHP